MNKDWVYECGKYIEEYLTKTELLPRPHLGILGTKYEYKFEANVENEEDKEDEIRQSELSEAEPLLSEVEEKSKFIPNRVSYQLLIEPKSNNSKIKIIIYYNYRINYSKESFNLYINQSIKENERSELVDPSPNKNFLEEKIIFEIPITYPYSPIINVSDTINGDNEIPVTNDKNVCMFNYKWHSSSDKYSKKIKNKVKDELIETKHEYSIEIKGRIKAEQDGKYLLHIEVANLSDQSDSPYIVAESGKYVKLSSVNYGYLLNFKIINELSNSLIIDVPNSKNISPFSRTAEYIFPTDKLEFRDYCFYIEKIPKLKLHTNDKGIEVKPSQSLTNLKYSINPIIGKVLDNNLGWKSLYKFQVDVIDYIMKNLNENPSRVNCISARTAAGKTESFLIPIMDYCISNLDKVGTKALLIYPTKALANDQANRINSLLTFLNEELSKLDKREITFGIYHGDIDKDDAPDFSLFKCPYCEEKMNFIEKHAVCENEKCKYLLENSKKFINKNMKVTRKEIYERPPDILITNPDMLNYSMMHTPESHTIFGRTNHINRCTVCGDLLLTSMNRQKHSSLIPFANQDSCQGKLEKLNLKLCSPKFIVLDEIHLMYGAFGIHISYLLSRIKNLIKKYNPEATIINIASSATIRNPEIFLSNMYSVKKEDIDVIPHMDKEDEYYNYEETEETIRRFHFFTMPNSYKTTQTLSLAYLKIIDFFNSNKMGNPNVLTFVNTIPASIALIQACGGRISEHYNVRIDGHSTDFDKRERAEKEEKFNKGELQFLFATKTLEVGVDFNKINVVGLFGSPYSFNDYIQRIGRAGRRESALVFTFYRSFNPVDAFYYSNCYKFLSFDKNIRKEFMEDLPIDRYNNVIAQKNIYASILDYIASQDDAHEYYHVNIKPFFEKLMDSNINVDPKLIDWVTCSVVPCNYKNEEIVESIQTFLLESKNDFPIYPRVYFEKQINSITKKYFLNSLRSSDPDIPIFIPSRVNKEIIKKYSR